MIRKFKGINKQCGDWVYGEGIFTRGINDVYLNHKRLMIEVIEGTVCQYIGVEDSDGNEIYENDIVEYTYPYHNEEGDIITETYNRGVVFFSYETLAFRIGVKQGGEINICSFADLLEGNFKLKVVGNTFDYIKEGNGKAIVL